MDKKTELLRQEKQKQLLQLKGKIHWRGDLNQSKQGRVFKIKK